MDDGVPLRVRAVARQTGSKVGGARLEIGRTLRSDRMSGIEIAEHQVQVLVGRSAAPAKYVPRLQVQVAWWKMGGGDCC